METAVIEIFYKLLRKNYVFGLGLCEKIREKMMNYLAHIYLLENNNESMLGNFLGDFVNKSLENNFEDSIKRGIFMHRKIIK